MQLVGGIHNIRSQDQAHACVLTLDNFDGAHIGHQEVIKALVSNKRQNIS